MILVPNDRKGLAVYLETNRAKLEDYRINAIEKAIRGEHVYSMQAALVQVAIRRAMGD
jgi:hypothetical protein